VRTYEENIDRNVSDSRPNNTDLVNIEEEYDEYGNTIIGTDFLELNHKHI